MQYLNGTTLALLGGAGKIGSAIVKGLLREGAAPSSIRVTARHARNLANLPHEGLVATTDNLAAIEGADVIVICVHPDQVRGLISLINGAVDARTLVISVATGITTFAIEKAFAKDIPVFRAIPNIAANVGLSVTAVCRGRFANEEHKALTEAILKAIGSVEELDERHMNAATGLAGCGPAFALKVIEHLAEGGIKVGLPRDVSRRVAAMVLKGAAELVLSTNQHPAALKEQVTSPGGCTIDGLSKLEERGLPIALIDAVETSTIKAGKLFPDNG